MWAILWWLFLYIALPMGLAYLGGKLLAQKFKQPPSPSGDSQSRSWNPHTTEQEGVVHPRAYGKNMHHGNIIAKWTDVTGEEREVLYMVIEHGDGPTQGIGAGMIYINDQPIGNFPDATVQERVGTMDQTCMTGFEKTKLEYEIATELLYGEAPTIFTTPNDHFDDLEYTLMLPNGLFKYQKDGDRKASAVNVKVRVREHPAGGWTTVFDAQITGESLTPVFKLYKVNTLVPGTVVLGTQYDIEFSRTSAKDDRHYNDVYIKSVREVVNIGFEYPGKALIGITAVATTQLSGNVDVKVVREDRLVSVWNGTTWTIQYSRNRAWVVFDILTQPVISGNGGGLPWTIERYEGLDPIYLDLAFFYEWAQWCAYQIPDGYGDVEDRMPCDVIIDFQTDIWTFATDTAEVGRAHLYWRGNLLSGWIDKTVDEAIDLVTMDNVMARTWANAWGEELELAGRLEVFFMDSRLGYERTFVTFGNELISQQSNVVSIEGIGITTRGVAIHTAMFALERNRLIRNVNNFRVAKDGFRYQLGDVIKLQHRVPSWGQGYRVVSSSGDDTLVLDRAVEATVGELLYLRSFNVTTQVVTIEQYTIASINGQTVTIEEIFTTPPLKGSICAIDAAASIKTRRIIKLEPTVDNYFDCTVETYDEDLFLTDAVEPHNPGSYIWPGPSSRQYQQPVTRQEVVDLIAQLLPPQPDTDMPTTSNLTWTGSGGTTVTWSAADADDPIVFRYKGVSYEITPDDTTDEFIYWDPDFSTVFMTTNLASVALAAGNWLMCFNTDGVAHPAVAMQLIHGGVIQAGTISAETYMELRQTYVYTGDDSLDTPYPLEVPFKIIAEMTDILSIRLSFRLMPFRAYSTAAASGGGQTSSDGSGWPWPTYSDYVDPGDTDSAAPGSTDSTSLPNTGNTNLGSHFHDNQAYSDYADGPGSHRHGLADTYDAALGSHAHTLGGHGHTHYNTHVHTMGTHRHTVGIQNHTHTGPVHTHGVTYGLYEESNAPTVHFHVNNGAGFGAASANYTSDQLDVDLTSLISGTGWKAVRFDTTLRCRIFAIVECKLDITA